MEPFTTAFLSGLLANLAPGIIKGAGRSASKAIFGTEKEQAINRCLRNALTAFLATAEGSDKDEQALLDDIFGKFFEQEEVARELAALLEGEIPDRAELLKMFRNAGYDVNRLRGFDFETAMDAFQDAFITAAAEEKSLQETLKIRQLIEQTRLQGRILQVLEKGAETAEKTRDAARLRYLEKLRRYCQSLPLAALGGDEVAEEDITLESVYIDLDTTAEVELTDKEREKLKRKSAAAFPGRDKDKKPLGAQEAAGQATRMVLLGSPGSGKSTFVKNLCAWMAAANTGEVRPPKDFSKDLLPVLIVLRELVPRLARLDLEKEGEERRRDLLAQAVQTQITDDLKRLEAEQFAGGIREALIYGRCLLVLDGLDEVPFDLRLAVRQVVNALLARYAPERIIITCRVHSYVGDAVLPNFWSFTLAPFDREKIGNFIKAWYNRQKELGRVDAQQAKSKIDDLTRAALSEDLKELAENPMLLTTMAIIHQKEIGLPRERVRLYKLAVDILLRRWQKYKTGEEGLQVSEPLAKFLKDEYRLRTLMERLAYEAHRTGKDKGTADLERGKALAILEEPACLNDLGLAKEFLDYVDQRSGLLVGQGGEEHRPASYGFPHRTFQEYLAGSYPLEQREALRLYFSLAGEGDYWANAVQMGFEEKLYNRLGLKTLLDFAYRLCPGGEPKNTRERRAVLWSANIAALAGCSAIEEDTGCPDGGKEYLERLRPRLEKLLAGELPPPERALAGVNLALLGDKRKEVTAVDAMQFCLVPAGPFWMGSPGKDNLGYKDEKPFHLNEHLKYDYWMARYPVTVAQFREFVQDSGHKPNDPDSLKGYANHPAVYLTWYEALQFCDWLSARWQAKKWLPKGWKITLPAEAEWEKAARGGEKISSSPAIRSVEECSIANWQSTIGNWQLKNNQRRYPWGDDPDPNRANYADTGIGTTSAAGCFPGGKSPCGCEEMSGNVWEWTRSSWKGYPYDPRDGREDLTKSAARVVRGGAFGCSDDAVRCACRNTSDPDNRRNFIGFRVALFPLL